MIHVKDLSVSYGDNVALNSLSFDVSRGECLVVTGTSGCGKSTLARVLSGLIPQSIPASVSGIIRVAGIDPSVQPLSDTAQQIGSVFQNPRSQLFHLKVKDEVAFGPFNLGLDEKEIQSRVDWALDSVGLAGFQSSNPASLSGGQIQRVALAAALAMKPQVLILDEPTASLDVSGTRGLVETLKNLQAESGITILIIEHRLAEMRQLADKVLVLHEGQKVSYGPFMKVLGDHSLLRRYGLRRPTEEPLENWSNLLAADSTISPGVEPLLTLSGISTGYDSKVVIHDVDLDIYPREFIALVGDNGSGKSTLALAAAGLLRPMKGRVVFQGGRHLRAGLDVSLLFQDPSDQLFTDSVDEEVAFSSRNYRQFNPEIHDRTIAQLDLIQLRDRRPASLSIGQQQRTALASCLSLQPSLVILDEPTLGQDWGHLQKLMGFLSRLNDLGTAILLITHDFKLVYRYARRVVMMKEGRIVMTGHVKPSSVVRRRSEQEAVSLAS